MKENNFSSDNEPTIKLSNTFQLIINETQRRDGRDIMYDESIRYSNFETQTDGYT